MKKLTKLDTASIIALSDCMAVKKNETVLCFSLMGLRAKRVF